MFDELEEEPRVDLTPLIDVIFMLVIFFVMTMTFSKPVLDVVLPAAQNSEVKKKTAELVISESISLTIRKFLKKSFPVSCPNIRKARST